MISTVTSTNHAPEMMVGARSETGKVREDNQDRMTRTQVPLGDLYIVADGMGGYKGGALAAQLTIQIVEEQLRAVPAGSPPEAAITAAIEAANVRVNAEATSGNPETEKMGSTIVLLLVTGGLAYVAHVGDSRAYLVRRGRLKLLTHDHTAVQRMIDARILSEEQAEDHPDASVLSRVVGARPTVEPELLKPFPLEVGDGILLCSDGLSRYAKESRILELMTGAGSEQVIAGKLVDLALDAGGEDNVTVQFARFAARPPDLPSLGSRSVLLRNGGIAAAGFLLGAVCIAGFGSLTRRSGSSLAQGHSERIAPQVTLPSVLNDKYHRAATSMSGNSSGGIGAGPNAVEISALQQRADKLQHEVNEKTKQSERLQKDLDAMTKQVKLLQTERFSAPASASAAAEKKNDTGVSSVSPAQPPAENPKESQQELKGEQEKPPADSPKESQQELKSQRNK